MFLESHAFTGNSFLISYICVKKQLWILFQIKVIVDLVCVKALFNIWAVCDDITKWPGDQMAVTFFIKTSRAVHLTKNVDN